MIRILRDDTKTIVEAQQGRLRSIADELQDGVLTFLENISQTSGLKKACEIAAVVCGAVAYTYDIDEEDIENAAECYFDRRRDAKT